MLVLVQPRWLIDGTRRKVVPVYDKRVVEVLHTILFMKVEGVRPTFNEIFARISQPWVHGGITEDELRSILRYLCRKHVLAVVGSTRWAHYDVDMIGYRFWRFVVRGGAKRPYGPRTSKRVVLLALRNLESAGQLPATDGQIAAEVKLIRGNRRLPPMVWVLFGISRLENAGLVAGESEYRLTPLAHNLAIARKHQ